MSKLTYAVEVQLWNVSAYSTTWTDITADVIMPGLTCSSGTTGTTIKDRVSEVGTCSFDLNNSESNSAKLAGYYSPGHANARAGYDIGCPLRVRFTFEGLTRTKWYGRIYGIAVEPGTKLSRRTRVTAFDWMHQANKYTLKLPSYETNKRADEALLMFVKDVPVQPLSLSFDSGNTTFPIIFDNVDYRTTAMAEFQKLATSEIGWVSTKHNLISDEVLTFLNYVNASARIADFYTLPDSTSGKALNEDATSLLNEDGSNLLLDQTSHQSFDDTQFELAYSYGNKLYNHVSVTTYPRNVNNTVGVLFTMTEPVMIAAGATVDWLSVVYKDPDGRAISVCAKDIVPVVATTDYLFNTAADGTGTNITSDLAVTGIYGVNNTEFTFTNNNASDGYITFLQIRGKAIYLYDKVTRIAENEASIAQYGLSEFEYEMKYQPPPLTAQTIANVILSNYGSIQNQTVGETLANNPNAELITYSTRSDDFVQRFLCIDCNSIVNVLETQSAIEGTYSVRGWSFEVIGNNGTTGLSINETLHLFRCENSTSWIS